MDFILNFQKSENGLHLTYGQFHLVFGNRQLNREKILEQFPNIQLSFLKQNHGDVIHHVDVSVKPLPGKMEDRPLADAQTTMDNGLGLAILTADCLPILIFDSTSNKIAAVHAGWRGVENKIFIKTIEWLKSKGSDPKNIFVCVGPHLQMQSFEVDFDVKKKLIDSLNQFKSDYKKEPIKEENFVISKNEKFYVDLKKIILTQALDLNLRKENIYIDDSDTKTDVQFHSYRRDKENPGRNISFIFKSTDSTT